MSVVVSCRVRFIGLGEIGGWLMADLQMGHIKLSSLRMRRTVFRSYALIQ